MGEDKKMKNKIIIYSSLLLIMILLGCTEEEKRVELNELSNLSETNSSGMPDLGEIPDIDVNINNMTGGMPQNPFLNEPEINIT